MARLVGLIVAVMLGVLGGPRAFAAAPAAPAEAAKAPAAKAPAKVVPAPAPKAPEKAAPAPAPKAPEKAVPTPAAKVPAKAAPTPPAKKAAAPAPVAKAPAKAPAKAAPAPVAKVPAKAAPTPAAKAAPAPVAKAPAKAAPVPPVPKAAAAKAAAEKAAAEEAAAVAAAKKAALDEATASINALLKTKMVSFDFVDTPFVDAMTYMRALLDVNFIVAPELVNAPPLTLKVEEMTAQAALQWMARLCGAQVEVKEGVIYVSAAAPAGALPRWLGARRGGKAPLGRLEILPDGTTKFEFFIYENDLPPALRKKLLEALQKALKDMETKDAAAPPAKK